MKRYLHAAARQFLSRATPPLLRRQLGPAALRAGLWRRFLLRLWFDDIDGWAKTVWGDELYCNARDFVQRHIFYFGLWEPHLTRHIRAIPPSERVFLDIGANIGYFSLLASKNFRQVVAFEASPEIHAKLVSNIQRNDRLNINAVNVAVGDEHGEVVVVRGPSENLGRTSVRAAAGDSEGDELRTRLAPLDTLLDDALIENVRFIKIDVEGAEPPIVASLLTIVDRMRPDLEIVVEVTPVDESGTNAAVVDMVSALRSAGFKARRLAGAYDLQSYLEDDYDAALPALEQMPDAQADVIFSRA